MMIALVRITSQCAAGYFGLFGPQFEGRVKPAVADGYWAFLSPPSTGPHTLTIHAENTQGFNITVVYNLTIG
jgi:hypothetical protein